MEDDMGSTNMSRKSTSGGKGSKGLTALLYPVLLLMETPVSVSVEKLVSAMGAVIEVMQQLAFCINPHFGYSITGTKELSTLIFTTHFPIWDNSYLNISYQTFSTAYWIVAAPVVIISIYIAAAACEYLEHEKDQVVNKIMSPALHLVGSCFGIPILHMLAANMFCHDGSLWAFSTERCWQVSTTLHFFSSSIIGLLTVFIMLLVNTCLFDDEVGSSSLLARAHSRVDNLIIFSKVALVVLFHLLLGPGWVKSYCVFVVILNFLVFAVVSFVHPYYNLSVNKFRSAIHLSACITGIISLGATFQDERYIDHNSSTTWVYCLVPISAVIGWHVGGLRILHECIERSEHLSKFGEVYLHKSHFPTGLTANFENSIHANFQNEILEQGKCDETEAGISNKPQRTEMLISYIEHVVLATDVELSTRFLIMHAEAVRTPIGNYGSGYLTSIHMIAFASQIYVKALAVEKKLGIIHFHFALFIKTFCPTIKTMFALEQCDNLLREGSVSFSISYRSYKSYVLLRSRLGMYNKAHLYSLNRAKKYHKDALSNMATFWFKLMNSKNDLMSLASLANQITEKRDRGNGLYQRAIQAGSTDREVLNNYASFLEHVMLDKRQADQVKTKMLEVGEELRKNLMGAGQRSHSTTHNVTFKLLPQEETNTTNNNSAVIMSMTVLVAFVIIVLLAIIVFVISTMGTQLQISTIDKYHDCGKARTLVQIAAREVLYIKQIMYSGYEGSLSTHTELLHETLDQFTAVHNKLTVGKAPSRYSDLVSHFKDPHYLVLGCTGSCWIPVGLWSLGLEVIGSLTSVSMIDVNGTGTTLTAMDSDFQFLEENVPTVGAWAYNDTIELFRDENIENQSWVMSGMSLVLFLVFYLALTVKNLFELNFKKIGVNKIVAIHLFSLIPHSTQEQLHTAVKEKMKEFDRAARDEEKTDDADEFNDNAAGYEEEEEELRRGTTCSMSLQKVSVNSIGKSGRNPPLVSAVARPWHERKRDKRRKVKHVTFNLVGIENEPVNKPMTKLVEPEISVDDLAAVALSPEERLELISEDDDEQNELLNDIPQGQSASGRVGSDDNAPRKAVNIWVTALGILFLIALGCEAYFVYRHFHNLEYHTESLEFVAVTQKFFDYSTGLSRQALEYSSTGMVNPFWNDYWSILKGTPYEQSRRFFSRRLTGEELVHFGNVIDSLNRIHETEKIALTIAADGWNIPLDLSGDVKNVKWSPAPQPKGTLQLRNKQYGYTSSQEDLSPNRTQEQKIHQSQRILSSERFVFFFLHRRSRRRNYSD